MCNLYTCLILLIKLWAMKIGITFLSQNFSRYIKISTCDKGKLVFVRY